ncbi:uncharacterized protein LOC124253100 [Haliotis rubra]|uniref:uncharacterized protein LOC124253100 n=1 Tax=Haliotis rubra TaxID=36100 RepID=UPI001EE51438|nr:uncharacterized protein LOC124253100 [Haliotis rubra]
MPAKHCAYGICRSDNRYGERPEMAGVHFILFPKFHKEPEKCARWVRACSRDGFTTDKVNKYTYLCSKHFVGGNGPSFEHPDPIPATYTSDQVVHFSKKRKNPVERHPLPSKVSRLDPTSTAGDDGLSLLAVCAADHPYTSRKHPEDQETICTELNVCDIEETALTEHSSSDAACQATPSTQDMSSQAEFVCSSILVSKIYEKMTAQVPDSDCGISRNLDNKTCDLLFDNLVCNKKKFKYYTGMKTVHFNHLFSSLGDSVNDICYWRGNKMNSNKSGKCRVLTVKDQLVLTLVRLRRNLPTKDLSYRYNISVGSVSCIITTWIQFLYMKLITLKDHIFPSRHIIRKTLPSVFKSFKNIRVIVDCFEVFTERPSDYGEQGNMYSQYKTHNTLKVLLGISPTGAVTFVSDAYEGCISDRDIVRKSGFLQKINPGDLVLADRGFTIKDLLMSCRAHLNIPPFLGKRDKLTPKEDILTRSIARTRIHVERSVGRLREYRILSAVIPLSMKHLASQIVFVIGMLSNYQPPLVK